MKKIVFTVVILTTAFSFYHPAEATTYYIDFEGGDDMNDGLSPLTAWKHFPSDKNASGKAKLYQKFQPGDIFLFKGGTVYRGSIFLYGRYNGNGLSGQPIVLKGDGWGKEKAIIDGSVLIEGNWRRCESQYACSGNPYWQNIYYIDLPSDYSFKKGFFEDDEFLWYSQDPNPTEPFFYDRLQYLRIIPKDNPNIKQTRTSITDLRYFTQSDPNYWDGAYIIAWRIPNVTVIKKITGYDPITYTIYHEDLGGDLYTDRDSYYSVINHVSLIDMPGEFSLDEANRRFYVWPRGNDINLHKYYVNILDAGIVVSGAKHVNVEGFIVQKFNFGIRVYDSGGQGVPENIVVINNEIRKLKSNDWYALQISAINATVENNKVIDAQRAVGILGGGQNVLIKNNFVNRA